MDKNKYNRIKSMRKSCHPDYWNAAFSVKENHCYSDFKVGPCVFTN